MVRQLGQGIAALIVSSTIGIFLVYCALFRKGHQRSLAFASLIAVVTFGVQYAYYLCGDNRTTVDSEPIQWERPLFIGVSGVATAVSIGISVFAHENLILAQAGLTAATAGFMEFLYIGGTAADKRQDGYWFVLMLTSMFFLLGFQIWSIQRNKDYITWPLILLAGAMAGLVGCSALFGRAFLAILSGNAEDWLILIPSVVLFGFLHLAMNLSPGEKDFVVQKARKAVNAVSGGRLDSATPSSSNQAASRGDGFVAIPTNA